MPNETLELPHPLCSRCGWPNADLTGFGPVCWVPETSAEALTLLFAGKFDTIICRNCSLVLPESPTILVAFGGTTDLLVYFGSVAARASTARDDLRHEWATQGQHSSEYDSPDALRQAAAHRLAPQVERFNRVMMAVAYDTVGELLLAEWRELTPAFFAASQTLLSVPVPGYNVLGTIKADRQPTAEAMLRTIAGIQARVWLALCLWWGDANEKGPHRLEDDLTSLIEPGAIVPDAPEAFFKLADGWKRQTTLSHTARFCVEAVCASLHALVETPNPHASAWADLFFEQEVLLRLAPDDVPPLLRALIIGDQRAAQTISYEQAFDAAARLLADRGVGLLEVLADIAVKAGYPHLPHDLVNAIHPIGAVEGDKLNVERLLTKLGDLAPRFSSEALLIAAVRFGDLLLKRGQTDDVARLTDGVIVLLGDDNATRARAEARFGALLVRHRLPQQIIDRIGDRAQPWEHELDSRVRIPLWMERSNALRLIGHPAAALAIAEETATALDPIRDADLMPVIRRNLAILYREAGQHERALDLLLSLRAGPASREEKLSLLESLAVTYNSLGRFTEVLKCYDEALPLAGGSLSERRTRILVGRAAILAVLDRSAENIQALLDVPDAALDDPVVLVPYACGWLNLLEDREVFTEAAAERLDLVLDKLDTALKATLRQKDMLVHLAILRVLAVLADLIRLSGAEEFWETLDVGSRMFEGRPDAMALLALARSALERSELDEGRRRLMEVPTALDQLFGANADLAQTMQATVPLRHFLNDLATLARTGDWPLADVRLVAELKRDVIGRIYAARQRAHLTGTIPPPWHAPSDAAVVRLAAVGRPVAVLEWLDDREAVAGLVTVVSTDGKVTARWLTAPPGDLDDLGQVLGTRLRDWTLDNADDPFDLPAWQLFTQWLHSELEPVLPEGGHLVVIEHEELAGLHWHVAGTDRWTVSYIPSWTELLTLFEHPPERPVASLGLTVVPRFGDSKRVRQALAASVVRIEALAEQYGLALHRAEHGAADHAAVCRVLETSDLATLLCHGYVEPGTHVVAWMIAHNGALPLAHAVAAATPAGRVHRFTWEDCQRLQAAPAVLFSAACSSGVAHSAGLGERLGLFSALRRAGTRALVAPRWDIIPRVVLPIMDDAIGRYLAGGRDLVGALQEACATSRQPTWLAWSLAIEGDWR